MNRVISLTWAGRGDANGRQAPEPESPVQAFESECGQHRYLFGDNHAGLTQLAATHRGQVSLVYMDPPFLTNREHEAIDRARDDDGAITRKNRAAFDDRWNDRAHFLDHMEKRLVACRALLADHGSLVLHVDPKTSHYLKVLLDEIFGPECFASEIIWRYRRWPAKTPNFQRVHDVLLRYRKNADVAPRFNQPYEPLAASTLATWGTKKQRAQVDTTGRRTRSTSTSEESAGVPMGDVWDIGVIAPVAKERTGYPTQKPEALLQRVISALSDPGELVLDPYAGSGTTLAVAARLGRRFIGMDQGAVAKETTFARLARQGHHMMPPAAPASETKLRTAPRAARPKMGAGR